MKKYIKIMLVLATACMCLTACSKKDTGIIVNVGDTNNDSSQNEQVVGSSDSTITGNAVEGSTINQQVVTRTELNEVTNLVGTWVTSNGTIYEFKTDGTLTGYLVESNENVRGTYETDNKTYLNMVILKDVEVIDEESEENESDVEIANAESTDAETIIETEVPEVKPIVFETVEEPHKYTIQSIVEASDNNGTELTIIENSIETVLIRSNSIASNNEDYKEPENTASEPKSLTPEEVEESNQIALELGIDPLTGLPLPEEPVEETTEDIVEQ